MTIRGPEPALDALVARLNATLATNVAAVNAEHSDGIIIDPPAVILDYMPPTDQAGLQGWPTVGVGMLPGKWQDDIGFEATGVYGFAIVAFLLDADQHALVRKVARYHLAMARCVLAGRSLGTGLPGEPWGVTLKGWDLGDAIPQRPAANSQPPYSYWSYCLLGIECKMDEA